MSAYEPQGLTDEGLAIYRQPAVSEPAYGIPAAPPFQPVALHGTPGLRLLARRGGWTREELAV